VPSAALATLREISLPLFNRGSDRGGILVDFMHACRDLLIASTAAEVDSWRA
jgi:hypothetical protein